MRDQPPEHVHEQARQRQVGPIGIRRDVEQHDAAGALGCLGHQRRAVRQRRPGMRCQIRTGLGQHLTGNGNLTGNPKPGEG